MVLDKALQKSIGFDGQTMNAQITMSPEELEPAGQKQEEPVSVSSGMDVLTAIKTRQSIRKFTSRPVGEELVTAMLCCGMYAPTAKISGLIISS